MKSYLSVNWFSLQFLNIFICYFYFSCWNKTEIVISKVWERYYLGRITAFSSETFLSNIQYFFSIKFGKKLFLTKLDINLDPRGYQREKIKRSRHEILHCNCSMHTLFETLEENISLYQQTRLGAKLPCRWEFVQYAR